VRDGAPRSFVEVSLIPKSSRVRLVGAAGLLALALAAVPAVAGPPGFAFLEIPSGTRASAMGGAFASVGEGVEAAFWNPAGLEQVRGLQVMGGHYELMERLRHDHFAVAGRVGGLAMSASIRALYSEPIEERDELGNLIGSFGSHDLELGVGVARSLAGGFTAGLSAQMIRERVANSAATTYGFGGGLAFVPARWPAARAAIQISGLGPDAAYSLEGGNGDPVPLPTSVQGGVSYRLEITPHLALRSAVEARVTRGRNGVGLAGLELAHPTGAALRAGLRVNDDASSLSFGAGYGLGALRLDYAFVPMRLDLGDTHRVSFEAQF
jgi:hypothetical protein